jgi:aminoglycoside phosphotransferase family enzyme
VSHEADRDEAEVSLERKVAFLRQPDAYADHPGFVEAKETHMSWVFLTREHAYKLKKPIRRGPLDYASLAARRLNARREVVLNRRLAPSVYLGTVALCIDADARLHLGGGGRAVDWLVQMRRLPQEHTLEQAILEHRLDEAAVRGAARCLALFFRAARPVPLTPDAYRARFEALIRDTHHALQRPMFELSREHLQQLADAQLGFLAAQAAAFGARAGHVVEGHGDLRPEHVYLGDEPLVMDCLEFDRSLRELDPADELAFLAMECERLGEPAVGPWLFAVYREVSGDAVAPALTAFYAASRAFLRAKLALWHLDSPGADPAHWRLRAHHYLALAEKHVHVAQTAAGLTATVAPDSRPVVPVR